MEERAAVSTLQSARTLGWPKKRHHDYINVADFPPDWLGWPFTVEVEAKTKELAVAPLLAEVSRI